MSFQQRREKLFSVYVGNLHPSVTKDEIIQLFCKCGTIGDCVIMQPKSADQSSRYGFVRYGCKEAAVKAIKELNGWCIKSKRIIVDIGHETYDKIKKNEPENVVPNATVTKTDERLPAVSHIDSIKNMVRVKEACVRIDSEAFTPLGVVKVSRITTEIAKRQYPELAHTSIALKPTTVLDGKDPMLKAYRKMSREPGFQDLDVVDVFHKLLNTQLSDSPDKHACHSGELDSVEQESSCDVQVLSKLETSLELEKQNPSNDVQATQQTTCKPQDRVHDVPLSEASAATISRDSQDVQPNSDAWSSSDVSWLPPSLHKSRLARLTGKPHRPAVRMTLRVPFLSPFNNQKSYNSEDSSSQEFSSSISS